jgi:hypothetical protein
VATTVKVAVVLRGTLWLTGWVFMMGAAWTDTPVRNNAKIKSGEKTAGRVDGAGIINGFLVVWNGAALCFLANPLRSSTSLQIW